MLVAPAHRTILEGDQAQTSMEVVRKLDETRWRAFVDDHPLGNIFHTPEMFQIISRTKGQQPELWAIINQKKQPLALFLPTKVTLIGGLLRHLTARAIAYGSVLCAPGSEGLEALEILLQAYKKDTPNSVLFTELRNLSDLSELQPVLNKHGFIFEDHLDYLIDLDRPVEKVLQGIGKRTRKKIRKGLRDQLVQMSEVTNLIELEDWYRTLQKTYSSAQVPLADRSMFEAAFEELYPKGMAKFLMARVNESTVACSAELAYKDTIYGWYGGSDRNYSQYLPNEMLIWHILEWGASNGYRVYDFGGAGKPDEEYGVRDFKAKFGGNLVNFGRNTDVHRPTLLKISRQGYKLYRRLL